MSQYLDELKVKASSFKSANLNMKMNIYLYIDFVIDFHELEVEASNYWSILCHPISALSHCNFTER